jgi:hypothetical protein
MELQNKNNRSIDASVRYRKNVFIEPLRSNKRRDMHTDKQTDGRDLWRMPLRLVRLPCMIYLLYQYKLIS